MAAGGLFLAVLTIQYVLLVLDEPEPFPWERGQAFQTYRVDMNTAGWIEWSQLEGIGPSLAHRIVADRNINGPFASIDDLSRVEGIGPAKLQAIRPWLFIPAEAAESVGASRLDSESVDGNDRIRAAADNSTGEHEPSAILGK